MVSNAKVLLLMIFGIEVIIPFDASQPVLLVPHFKILFFLFLLGVEIDFSSCPISFFLLKNCSNLAEKFNPRQGVVIYRNDVSIAVLITALE